MLQLFVGQFSALKSLQQSLGFCHAEFYEHTKVRPRNGPPRNGNLLFTVRPIRDAVENYQERQLAEADAERQRQEAMRRVEDYNDRHPDKPITVTEIDRPSVPAP